MMKLHVCFNRGTVISEEVLRIFELLSLNADAVAKLNAYYTNLFFDLTLQENREEILATLAMFRMNNPDLYNQVFYLTTT